MPLDFEIIGEITQIEEIEEGETEIPDTTRFAVCIRASDCTDLLKVYPVIEDTDAEETGMIRIIDESGEDYLHATERFIVLTLPPTQAHELVQAMKRQRLDDD
ncbi:MAG: hypothetical protein M3P29_01985 [Acidobacteriota bacterium]|nr:hypothetical protein [Acidobacteriota bacterium]